MSAERKSMGIVKNLRPKLAFLLFIPAILILLGCITLGVRWTRWAIYPGAALYGARLPQFSHYCLNPGQVSCRWILASDLLLFINEPPDQVSKWYAGRFKVIHLGPLIIVFFSFFTETPISPGQPVYPVNTGFFFEWQTS